MLGRQREVSSLPHRGVTWCPAVSFRLVAQIHDELLFEVEDPQVAEFAGEPRGKQGCFCLTESSSISKGLAGSLPGVVEGCQAASLPHAARALHPGQRPLGPSTPRGPPGWGMGLWWGSMAQAPEDSQSGWLPSLRGSRLLVGAGCSHSV